MRKRNSNNAMVRTVFSNTHEATFNPNKKWYGTISTSTGSFIVTYESTTRSVAVDYFEDQAKLAGGTLDKFIGTFKR